ncbi:MAG TPA: CHRD domain-containing protein [Vicinamibacterales bacterium]|nr:CHRD domain-containing protein [Vicinamibacterales bacterium]
MYNAQRFLIALLFVGVGLPSISAQASRTFKTRLAPVPLDVSMQSTIAGTGSVTAVLTGAKLSITGSFEGLKSPATIAQVHKSPVRGVRGPVVFDVAVTKGDALNGTLSGTFDLTPPQVADLGKGLLYVQVHSEKAPDGNLWGWLTPQENKR